MLVDIINDSFFSVCLQTTYLFVLEYEMTDAARVMSKKFGVVLYLYFWVNYSFNSGPEINNIDVF